MDRLILCTVCLVLICASTAHAQISASSDKLSGPRIGVTAITGSNATRIRDELDVYPVVTQFGWQFETELFRSTTGLSAVTEFVPLVGGLEQGQFLPSLSWMVGLRTSGGAEFAVGPNLSPAGFGLAFAGGVTYRTGELNLPVNLAVVPSRGGLRISVLGGFNLRR
jgi:hypothetical protein